MSETDSTAFQLKLSSFEGPLDLLLHLIEKEELDITAVSLMQVADQFLAYVHTNEAVNVPALSEFIVIGAKLIYLKSRALLPRPIDVEELEIEEEDVGEELTRLLQEYKLYKEAAGFLRQFEEEGRRSYPRLAPPPDVPLPLGLDGVTLDILAKLFQEALARKPDEPQGVISGHEITVAQKVEEIAEVLKREGRASFRRIMEECQSKLEVIVSFLAILEMIKSLRLRAEQELVFGDITLLPLAGSPKPADEEEAPA